MNEICRIFEELRVAQNRLRVPRVMLPVVGVTFYRVMPIPVSIRFTKSVEGSLGRRANELAEKIGRFAPALYRWIVDIFVIAIAQRIGFRAVRATIRYRCADEYCVTIMNGVSASSVVARLFLTSGKSSIL